jgi:hypothetical protein
MKFLSVIGDGLALIGDGLAAIGNGFASVFGGSGKKSTPEDDYLDRLHAEQENSYTWTRGAVNKTESVSISITDNGVRKFVRTENGKVVESENVDDPEAFIKKYTDQADEQFAAMDDVFKDMGESMDKTFKSMDETFKKVFKK